MPQIYDPERKNDFLTDIYFSAFKKQLGYGTVQDPATLKNDVLLIHSGYLTPELIQRLKDNGNKIVACDINDNSYPLCPEFWNVDLILKFAGIQNTQTSSMTWLDDTLGATKIDHRFMDDATWARYREMVDAGRIMSLPYIPWGFAAVEFKPFEERRPVLVRGGNHIMRFALFLHLASMGLMDERSQFFATYYLGQHCPECRETYKRDGVIPYLPGKECPNQPSPMNQEVLNQGWQWNNRCIPRFYCLAEQFAKSGRQVDMAFVQKALHGRLQHYPEFFNILRQYKLYADHKLIFSIYAPPRFWEAASVMTVNMVLRRTADQSFFPEMREGEHYLTFSEDLSDIQEVIESLTPEKFRAVSYAAYDLFMRFIMRPRPDLLADELIRAIQARVENV